jgi:hypothetical protein
MFFFNLLPTAELGQRLVAKITEPIAVEFEQSLEVCIEMQDRLVAGYGRISTGSS